MSVYSMSEKDSWKGRKSKIGERDSNNMDFGDWISLLRSRRYPKGWSKKQLSDHVGISPQYMNVIENEKKIPTEEVITNMIQALDLGEDAERYTWFLADALPPEVLEKAKRDYFQGIEAIGKRLVEGGH